MAPVGRQQVAAEAKIPLVISGAPGSILSGKQRGRWSFRAPPSLDVRMTAMQSHLIGYGKKRAFLTASPPTGTELLSIGRRPMKEAGAAEAMAQETLPNATDERPFIGKLRSIPLDVIIGGLVASDLGVFLRQWEEADMTGRVPFAQAGVDDSVPWEAGPKAATGVYARPRDFMDPENQGMFRLESALNGEEPGADAG